VKWIQSIPKEFALKFLAFFYTWNLGSRHPRMLDLAKNWTFQTSDLRSDVWSQKNREKIERKPQYIHCRPVGNNPWQFLRSYVIRRVLTLSPMIKLGVRHPSKKAIKSHVKSSPLQCLPAIVKEWAEFFLPAPMMKPAGGPRGTHLLFPAPKDSILRFWRQNLCSTKMAPKF